MPEKIKKILEYHKNDKSKLIQILLDIQEEERWLSIENLTYISKRLDIPLTNVFQAATFYNAFSFKPRGRHTITVCVGTACHVRGAPILLERISQKLEIMPGNTTKDKRFTLKTANCLGCCALGPVISINDRYFSDPSSLELEKIFKNYQ